jgi:hypothetical protein
VVTSAGLFRRVGSTGMCFGCLTSSETVCLLFLTSILVRKQPKSRFWTLLAAVEPLYPSGDFCRAVSPCWFNMNVFWMSDFAGNRLFAVFDPYSGPKTAKKLFLALSGR